VIVLAIDTCDSRGSVALLKGGVVLALRTHEPPEEYSSWLIPAVEGAWEEAGATLRDLDGIAVAAGPGSFTGVRVGLTAVKAWAEVGEKQVAAVSRLEAIAEEGEASGDLVAAFADAGRGQVFGGVYRRAADGWALIGEEMVIAPGEFVHLVRKVSNGDRVSWPSTDPEMIRGQLEWRERKALGESIVVVEAVLAPAIARIGARRISAGKTTDALRLEANYVRRSDAEIFWKDPAHGR
jgi:tRNA threonylcarbamoyladenosine biosynthesis protein TsaB